MLPAIPYITASKIWTTHKIMFILTLLEIFDIIRLLSKQQMLLIYHFILESQPSNQLFCCLSNTGAKMLSTLQEEKLDPRVKRTRGLILQSFMEILPEKGFQAVSVQDITDKAGINRATFYAHFTDKYQLLDRSIQLL